MDGCWADACAIAATRIAGLDPVALREAITEYAHWWWSDPDRMRRGRLDLRKTTADIVGEVFRRLGYDDADCATEVAMTYRDLREERATVFEGAVETIEWFRAQGVRLGMMTNGAAAAQRAKIERFDLERYFDHIIVEGEFGFGKPDRRVFETLMTELRAEPANAWAVGDSLAGDVLPAIEMGMHGVWVDVRGDGLPEDAAGEPHRIIQRLTELHTGPSIPE